MATITTIDFSEIRSDTHFEQLVAECFRRVNERKDALSQPPYPQINSIRVERSGEGPDEGRDILLTFDVTDFITVYTKRWIVQCKCYSRPVSRSDLRDVNIPTLIHSYGADGYLLVCRSHPTSGLTKMFERLRNECTFGYEYEWWDGENLKSRIFGDDIILQQFFPQYFAYLQSQKAVNRP